MKIGVLGCKGRVGSLIVEELQSGRWPELSLAGGSVHNPDKIGNPYFMTAEPGELFARADVLIDFTLPGAIAEHSALAAKYNKPLVIGTSGLKAEHEAHLKKAAQSTAILHAANTSVGVNVLLALVEEAARKLDITWDAEILDLHHKHKIDAPSGTSYALAHSIQKGRNQPLNTENLTLAREGHTGPRKEGTIGFSVQRGGDVVAENSAIFFGSGERLEITHKAQDRSIFAKGALKAAQWLHAKPAGLYTMKDALGL